MKSVTISVLSTIAQVVIAQLHVILMILAHVCAVNVEAGPLAIVVVNFVCLLASTHINSDEPD